MSHQPILTPLFDKSLNYQSINKWLNHPLDLAVLQDLWPWWCRFSVNLLKYGGASESQEQVRSYLVFYNNTWPWGSFPFSAWPTPLLFGQDLNSIKRQLQEKANVILSEKAFIYRDFPTPPFLNLFIIIDLALDDFWLSVAHILC